MREGRDIFNSAAAVLKIWNRKEGALYGAYLPSEDPTKKGGSHEDFENLPDVVLQVRKARYGATKRDFQFDFDQARRLVPPKVKGDF